MSLEINNKIIAFFLHLYYKLAGNENNNYWDTTDCYKEIPINPPQLGGRYILVVDIFRDRLVPAMLLQQAEKIFNLHITIDLLIYQDKKHICHYKQ